MISFMVIGLPRSGTTWAANWLTTHQTHCLHDPLATVHYRDWDHIPESGKMIGVSCTGVFINPAWLNAHPARKVVLRKPLAQVNRSLEKLGLAPLQPWTEQALDQVEGLHADWTDLFDAERAPGLWAHLTGLPFDARRHAALREIEMQPKFAGLSFDADATRAYTAELRAVIQGRR